MMVTTWTIRRCYVVLIAWGARFQTMLQCTCAGREMRRTEPVSTGSWISLPGWRLPWVSRRWHVHHLCASVERLSSPTAAAPAPKKEAQSILNCERTKVELWLSRAAPRSSGQQWLCKHPTARKDAAWEQRSGQKWNRRCEAWCQRTASSLPTAQRHGKAFVTPCRCPALQAWVIYGRSSHLCPVFLKAASPRKPMRLWRNKQKEKRLRHPSHAATFMFAVETTVQSRHWDT